MALREGRKGHREPGRVRTSRSELTLRALISGRAPASGRFVGTFSTLSSAEGHHDAMSGRRQAYPGNPIDVFEVAIGGDEVGAGFHGMRSDPDVVCRNRAASGS